ncbi:carbon-nitrogen hydrolase family protein [Roseomonas sp. GC11]|uniref:carbon-nitrogen hydrolase family protein n=1 Tax=Roseomonas sp. GC11 TaxID=2950546 RepID=UPI002109B3CB|nr:carbon-nitrogen hydrolase family protein [Roseomonas sp. GC11]MCQ4161163.1 carbon-nitrogen hydrolase family protein [Roseomonas sp. GC11]
MTMLRLALMQYPVERPESVAAWAAKLDRWLAEAKAQGARMAVMPEYACAELGSALCGLSPATEAEELAALVAAAPAILEAMRGAARRAGLWLVPGSLPMRDADGAIRNRAPLIDPEGRAAFQDKHAMTRFEAERWGVSAGAAPAVFDTPWGRIGLSICYDSEFPGHVRAQVEAGAWLILVPTCTDTQHGFNRVRFSAAARALENQCFVAVSPTVGEAPWSAALDQNRGAAAVYGPIDRGFPEDGVIAQGAADAAQWVYADLDPARIAAVRREGAVFNHRDWPAPFPTPRPAAFA